MFLAKARVEAARLTYARGSPCSLHFRKHYSFRFDMRFKQSKSRWKWLLLLAAPIAAFVGAAKIFNTSPPTNSARTDPSAAPDLKTRFYSQSINQVFAAAQSVADAQKTWGRAWRVVPAAEVWAGPKHHKLAVQVPVLVFTDDLSALITTDKNGQTRVDVESHSRVGEGDWGENRRHIAQFLHALDAKLKASASPA